MARAALLLAVLSGGLAVLLVGLDVAFGVQVRVDAQDGSSWATVVSDGPAREPMPVGCAQGPFRLHVDNHRPVGAEAEVRVRYQAPNGTMVDLLRERWELAPFSSRSADIVVPAPAPPPPAGQGPPWHPASLLVEASPYTRYPIHVCVGEGLR
jgi:hypothetical protein